jgi:hypothetical protein
MSTKEAKMLKFAILVSACAIWSISPAAGADADSDKLDVGWGVWADQDQTNVYAFLENNDFKFRHRYQGKTYVLAGAWQTALGACWSDKNREQTGNLLIYANIVQCCMTAQFLGNNLVLTYVWDKPGGVPSPDPDRFCQNRVLRRLQSMPKD